MITNLIPKMKQLYTSTMHNKTNQSGEGYVQLRSESIIVKIMFQIHKAYLCYTKERARLSWPGDDYL